MVVFAATLVLLTVMALMMMMMRMAVIIRLVLAVLSVVVSAVMMTHMIVSWMWTFLIFASRSSLNESCASPLESVRCAVFLTVLPRS